VADKLPWDRLSTIVSHIFHLFGLLLVGWVLLDFSPKDPSFYLWAVVLCTVGGILFFGTWILYFGPLALFRTYQKYFCDRCERRTLIRRQLPMGLSKVCYLLRLSACANRNGVGLFEEICTADTVYLIIRGVLEASRDQGVCPCPPSNHTSSSPSSSSSVP
jgi:hypothetical protein